MVSESSPIQIRPLHKISELKAVEELQQEIWGCSELEVLPSLALIPLLEIGGVLLGAYDAEDLIGFVLGFPGFEGGKPILHSDMLAVKPAYRSGGLGYRLKLAQREFALAHGVDKITWTFDPLQSANAHLNFGKLGVMADRYRIDYYGRTSSALHRTGTDRLWVTWLLESERVRNRIGGGSPPLLANIELPTLLKVDRDNEPRRSTLGETHPTIAIEIPYDMNAIMAKDIDLATRWREATRAAFTETMAATYFVKDFSRVSGDPGQVGVYLLGMKGRGVRDE
jgi:predicted GNAT superfamily acetyltransferase